MMLCPYWRDAVEEEEEEDAPEPDRVLVMSSDERGTAPPAKSAERAGSARPVIAGVPGVGKARRGQRRMEEADLPL